MCNKIKAVQDSCLRKGRKSLICNLVIIGLLSSEGPLNASDACNTVYFSACSLSLSVFEYKPQCSKEFRNSSLKQLVIFVSNYSTPVSL